MSLPDFLRFRPVPVRRRHDGWTADLQLRFVLNLARGMGPDEAARRLGRSRQSVYALRRKPGAEAFAAAWDQACAFAQQVNETSSPLPPAESGIDTLLVPRHYRGRLIGFVQREDFRGVMRRLAMLDRLGAAAERSLYADPDFVSFEDLLARICGPEIDKTDEIPATSDKLCQFPDGSAPSTRYIRPARVNADD